MAKTSDRRLTKSTECDQMNEAENGPLGPKESTLTTLEGAADALAPAEPAPPSPPPVSAHVDASPAASPVRTVAVVPLEVFQRVSGIKRDQFAGFAWYAERHGLKPRPVASWHREYERFVTRAVG
jgi:hypothetical protein